VVQETFIVVYQQLDRYQPGSDAGAWIRSIARNCARSEGRRRGRPGQQAWDDAVAASFPAAWDAVTEQAGEAGTASPAVWTPWRRRRVNWCASIVWTERPLNPWRLGPAVAAPGPACCCCAAVLPWPVACARRESAMPAELPPIDDAAGDTAPEDFSARLAAARSDAEQRDSLVAEAAVERLLRCGAVADGDADAERARRVWAGIQARLAAETAPPPKVDGPTTGVGRGPQRTPRQVAPRRQQRAPMRVLKIASIGLPLATAALLVLALWRRQGTAVTPEAQPVAQAATAPAPRDASLTGGPL
jgi:hypothetical protein